MNRLWPKVFEVSVEDNCAFSVSSWTNFSGVCDVPWAEVASNSRDNSSNLGPTFQPIPVQFAFVSYLRYWVPSVAVFSKLPGEVMLDNFQILLYTTES